MGDISQPEVRLKMQSTRRPRDTVANIPAMVSALHGTSDEGQFVRKTEQGLRYLVEKENEYFSQPQSHVNGHTSSFRTPAGHHLQNGNTDHLASGDPEIFLYHIYWSGPFTWRVELFIKSYLSTQNVPLSRLWIWVDVSTNPNAIEDMLSHPLTKQFLPLLSSGALVLKPWTLPVKIPVRSDLDHYDGVGFIDNADRRGIHVNSTVVADGIIRDPDGSHHLLLQYWARPHDLSNVATSDIVRFVVLHLHGGIYFDVDIILFRDFRPLLLHGADFAERWGALGGKGDYNTAVLRLHKQSSLSTWCLRTGMRLALNFHPRTIGRALWKDGRNEELLMFESAMFDPVWVEFATMREGPPTTPCLSNFIQAFQGDVEAERRLSVKRCSDNFYNGSFAYHIHNLWNMQAEPGSWIDAVKKEHDAFFKGERPNRYNEWWEKGALDLYA